MTTQVVHHQSNNNDDMLVQARAGQIATRRAPVVYENGVGKWTRCEVLGRGAHGVVYRGVVEETLESIAVKQVQMNGTGRSQLQAAANEIDMLPRLRHPNVVRFLGIEEVDDHLNIFLEYLDKGSVRDRLERGGRMSEAEAAGITRKLLAGLAYLHARGITHRDIKGANVLLSRYGAVKLADFGTSKLMGQESVLSGLKGTPHWMAPEVIRDQQRGHKGWIRADVWSVGCTVIEMLTGRKPWADVPNAVAVMFKIARGLTPPIDREVSPDATSFIRASCCPEPSQRQSVEQLMKHPFLARARRFGAEAGHPASPSDSSTFDRTPNLYHAIDPACLSVRRREQRWGGPGVSCSTSITSPPGRCHSRSRDSFSDLFSSGGTPNASWDSTASDRVLDDSELLDGVVWGEDITGRPPGRSRETAASKQRRKTNTRAPQRSAFAIVAAADTALGRALSTSGFPPHDHRQHMHHHNFHRRMKGLKGGASARRALWRSIQSDGSSGSGEAWSPSSVSPRESPPPKYSQSNNRHSAEAPPPCSSLSGQGGGTDSSRAGAAIITTGAVASVDGFTRISPPGSREAVQQRLVTSQMVRKKEQQQQLERWELLLGKCIASVRRSGSGWGEATAAAGLAKNPTACSRNSHERQAADEEIRAKHRRRQQQQQQQQQQRQWLSFSSAPPAPGPPVPQMLAADRARRGLQFGGRGQGGDSSPPIPTSPVLVRRASTFARALPIGLDDQVDANGGRATFSHGSGKLLSLAHLGESRAHKRNSASYARSPRAVRVAARENLEELEGAHADQVQPDEAMSVEIMDMKTQRGLVGLAPAGCIGNPQNNMKRQTPMGSGPRRRGRPDPTLPATMRTRSAGAIASAVKLPPLVHEAEAMRAGSRATGGVRPGADLFGGVLAGPRLITSAPTVVGSSPLCWEKTTAGAARVVPSILGGHSPMGLFAGKIPRAACPVHRPAERRVDSSEVRTVVVAPGGGNGADSGSYRSGEGDCQHERPMRNFVSLLRRPPAAMTLTPKPAKGGIPRPQVEGRITGGNGSSGGGGALASILCLPSPCFDGGGSAIALLTTSCESNSGLFLRGSPGAVSAASDPSTFSASAVQATRTAALAATRRSHSRVGGIGQ